MHWPTDRINILENIRSVGDSTLLKIESNSAPIENQEIVIKVSHSFDCTNNILIVSSKPYYGCIFTDEILDRLKLNTSIFGLECNQFTICTEQSSIYGLACLPGSHEKKELPLIIPSRTYDANYMLQAFTTYCGIVIASNILLMKIVKETTQPG